MFTGYLKLGIEHILDINGVDHILFLVALVIIFDLKLWKEVLVLATAFTLGHSLTLALAALGLVSLNSQWIEILIAASIALTALYNIYKTDAKENIKLRYLSALIFGLIHGLGFSNFFKSILGNDNITLPLFAFNVGVEIAQLIIVLAVLLLSTALIKLGIKKRHLIRGTSLIIFIWSLKMILERI